MAHSIEHRVVPITPRASAIDLPSDAALSDDAVASLLHPDYGPALRRFPAGQLVSRGLPFRPAGGSHGRRWLVLDRVLEIDAGDVPASDLVLLQFCDAWRDASGSRPPGAPIGWVLPVGEPLARVQVRLAGGGVIETILRRRFEVNEGIIGWGSMAFLALPHRVEGRLDWRGPHARQGAGVYAAPGHSGPLTILPGTWGAAQTGVQDHVPSATGDLMQWLHAVDVRDPGGRAQAVRSISFEPLEGEGDGRLVVLSAITAFDGTATPLRWSPRRALRVVGAQEQVIDVDLGVVGHRRALPAGSSPGAIVGWGLPDRRDDVGDGAGAEIVELTAAADAAIVVGDASLPLQRLTSADGSSGSSGASPPSGAAGAAVRIGEVAVEVLPEADASLEVRVLDASGSSVPARVRIRAHDGRSLAPEGHRSEVNPAIYEDSGADVILRGATYAYVSGAFRVALPPSGATLEVVRGPEITPASVGITARDLASGILEVHLGEALEPSAGRWVSADTHVHFLAPSTALLQARAENVNVVHLLATQWGDHHTNLTDIGSDILSDDGGNVVWVGSENRQNMLGHVGIVGTTAPILPFASGGPPEGPIGGSVTHLMADWLAHCRALGGLAIGAHFPLPMAEVAADIDAGLLDALELQCFDPALESPPIREWYRYLDAGYRLPLVGGTDKMSAEVPLGQVRTWARLGQDEPLGFEAWAAAVRGGRTFVTSGPILELRVEGAGPGDVLEAAPGAMLEAELTARAAQPIIGELELVQDGQVVATTVADEPTTRLTLRERMRVDRPGWIAARSRSPFAIGSAFSTAMAAHTSAIYVDVAGRPRRVVDMATPLAIVDGTRAWVEHLAPIRDEAERARFRAFLDRAERNLRRRAR